MQDQQTTLDRLSVTYMGNCSNMLNLAGSLSGSEKPNNLEDTTSKQDQQHRVSISRYGLLSCVGYPCRPCQLQRWFGRPRGYLSISSSYTPSVHVHTVPPDINYHGNLAHMHAMCTRPLKGLGMRLPSELLVCPQF